MEMENGEVRVQLEAEEQGEQDENEKDEHDDLSILSGRTPRIVTPKLNCPQRISPRVSSTSLTPATRAARVPWSRLVPHGGDSGAYCRAEAVRGPA